MEEINEECGTGKDMTVALEITSFHNALKWLPDRSCTRLKYVALVYVITMIWLRKSRITR